MANSNVDGVAIEHQILAGLKGFQRTTVDYVFKRMYEDPDPAMRFLVADEVGLGKTLVARGLIARVIRHLQSIGTERIDIIYICSNADIAIQNIQRLRVTGELGLSLATRITLLPLKLHQLTGSGVNFVSFTPGTSFNMASQGGRGQERAVIFRLLEYALDESLDRACAYRTLRAGMGDQNFRQLVAGTSGVASDDRPGLDLGLSNAFRAELRTRPDILSRLRNLMLSDRDPLDDSDWVERMRLIGDLRKTLARSCIEALQPDLVILDEFQRFRDLLDKPDPDDVDDIRHLAHHLFVQNDARTLLLSATPYKMYTMRDEEQDDHYADFLKTAEFLMGNEGKQRFAEELRGFGMALMNVGVVGERNLLERKRAIERRLRRFMTRTERLTVSSDRNGMLTDNSIPETRLTAADVQAYAAVDRLSQKLNSGDVTEYWKSSPYLLNFMSDYKLKRDLRSAADDPATRSDIASAIDPSTLLRHAQVTAYERLDHGNARLRGLAADTVDAGAWQLLWLPPSLPYYHGRGAYADPRLSTLTKRLIFSSWNVVPDAVSMLLSFEAERNMMLSRDPATQNTPEARTKLRGLLAIRRQDGNPSGMSTFSFLYPCVTLAEVVDPFLIARDLGASSREVHCNEILAEATRRIGEMLAPVTRQAPADGPEDQRWYWAAPLILDRRRWPRAATEEWLADSSAVRDPSSYDGTNDDDAGAWAGHVELARSVLSNGTRGLRLGRVPADLLYTTALLALGAPGTCALRSIARVLGRTASARQNLSNAEARDAALRIAWGFRTLYNVPEVMSLLRARVDEETTSYWRRAAEEGLNGNLQAVLDEYIHLLPEWLGVLDGDYSLSIGKVASVIHDAVAIRAVNYSWDEVYIDGGRLSFASVPMRARFALRFGRDVNDDQKVLQRSSVVRSAFNSPFWPFLLTSTSVGQEGLDFHQYCHAIVHWNLPANPVDLEQREGRVHRYKGHAIRKNIAERHRETAFKRRATDPWKAMFREAVRESRGRHPRDIEPFWIYEGSARIERHVPLLPLSREVEQLTRLRRSLAAYRLVFGQPRQEDLIAYLQNRMSPEDLERLVKNLCIDLRPR